MFLFRLVILGLLLATLAGCAGAVSEREEAPPDGHRSAHRERLRDRLGASYDEPLPPASPEELARGAEIYDLLCRACHGRTGNGKGRSARQLPIKPPDLGDREVAAFFSDRAKLEIVAGGIPGTPMIGWERMLDERERLAVLHYMNELAREGRAP